MSQTLTKEKPKTSAIIEEYLNQKDIIFYKREEEETTIFLLPYRIRSQNLRVDINLFTFPDSNLCRMGFNYKLNSKKDSGRELLDMNSKLANGNLSVASDSNHVSFITNFLLAEDTEIDITYTKTLYLCFTVLLELQEKDIIEADIDNEE